MHDGSDLTGQFDHDNDGIDDHLDDDDDGDGILDELENNPDVVSTWDVTHASGPLHRGPGA